MHENNGLLALAEAVKARRAELGLTHEDVLAADGPSGVTLTKIESAKGSPPRALTLKRLDTALQWEPGSAARVLSGGTPLPVRMTPPALSGEELDDTVKRFADAAERQHRGVATEEDQKFIREFLRSGQEVIRNAPPERNVPLKDLLQAVSAAYRASMKSIIRFMEKPSVSEEERQQAARDGDLATSQMIDLLILMAHESEDFRAREKLDETYELRAVMRSRLSDPKHTNVTSLADRRKVPPPPDMDDLGVAASRREKQSDRERDDDG